jgi:hypothetical protein
LKQEVIKKVCEELQAAKVSAPIAIPEPKNPDENTLKCTCGGDMFAAPRYSEDEIMKSVQRIVGKIPKHKNNRIQKKWRKKWAEKAGPVIMGLKLARAMTPPRYVCSLCGKSEGFYTAIGRNLIKIEPLPLPEACRTLYERDVDAEEIVVPVVEGVKTE